MKTRTIAESLDFAYLTREKLGAFEATDALRIFYGPGESQNSDLKAVAIDRFGPDFWITTWSPVYPNVLAEIVSFLRYRFADLRSVVMMDRGMVESKNNVITIAGSPPEGHVRVNEFGIPYYVQFSKVKHPGLFLDHAELRQFLLKTQKEQVVLNLFSYTGSLSVAAGRAGAARVVTVDLSKATIDWAQENWKLAGLPEDRGNFIYGDVFEWLPKLRKRGDMFDTILCDPPSFSRSKRNTFSTNKDLTKLHEQLFPLLNTGGLLVTSINSENYGEKNFLKDVEVAAEKTGCRFQVLKRIDLPFTFPTGIELNERYLKGFYLIKL